jgi:hypothetical protein
MKHAGIALVCLAGGVVFYTEAYGSTTESAANPYQGIVDRNVFGLKPPPPPPSNEPVRPPPPAITLTGITTILGKKLAFLNVQVPAKPAEQLKGGPQSFMLGVGEREGEIEVLDIDEKGGIVKVNDYGVVTNVPFAKLPSTPSAPVNTAGIPSPNVANPALNPGMAQRSIPGLPTRTLRLGNNQPGANGQNTTPNASGYQPQTAGLGSGIQTHNPSVPFSETRLTPEEDAILTETDRELHRNNPNFPPPPPTPLTSPEDLKGIMAPGSTYQAPGSRPGKGFQPQ